MAQPTTMPLVLQVAQIVPVTEAEGPGKRFALWFQGCPLRCPGCCNPEMLAFTGGQPVTVAEIGSQIAAAQTTWSIEGITLLGGEPLAHARGAAALAQHAQTLGLSVMVFSGFTLEVIRRQSEAAVQDLLDHSDILVDGPYRRELPETRRRWLGSANQQIHFLSARYRPDDPCWQLPNTLEIRWHGTTLTVNGFPARQAKDFWQRSPGA